MAHINIEQQNIYMLQNKTMRKRIIEKDYKNNKQDSFQNK